MSNQPKTNKKPTHDVFHVREGKPGSKGYWTRIGAAWMHDDQGGLNLQLEMMPIGKDAGRVVIRVKKPDEQTNGGN